MHSRFGKKLLPIREKRLLFPIRNDDPAAGESEGIAFRLFVAPGNRPAETTTIGRFALLWESWRRRTVPARGRTARGGTVAGTSAFQEYRWGSEGGAASGHPFNAPRYSAAPAPTAKKWYAVHTRARHEKVVTAQLCGRGIDTYLPLVEEIHRWSDRRKRVLVPVFPGYTFIHSNGSVESAASVMGIESVVKIVGPYPSGTPIPDAQIEAVRRLVACNVPCVNHPFLRVGQRVRVRGGPLDGVEGTLLAMKNTSSLLISIELIQRSLAVSIEGYDLEVI